MRSVVNKCRNARFRGGMGATKYAVPFIVRCMKRSKYVLGIGALSQDARAQVGEDHCDGRNILCGLNWSDSRHWFLGVAGFSRCDAGLSDRFVCVCCREGVRAVGRAMSCEWVTTLV